MTLTHGSYIMNLIAKPIIKDQYWVVTDGQQKVGNVVADSNGYQVKVNGINARFDTAIDLQKKTKINFQTIKLERNTEIPYSEYPTTKKVYNSILDIKRKLHLYTKTNKSKCYYAAGWFAINQNNHFEAIFCPKYIFIQRYPYYGPFKTQVEAENMINNL